MVRTSLFILGVVVSSVCFFSAGKAQQYELLPLKDTLKRDTVTIEEIVIHQKRSPEQSLEAKKAYHKEIFGLGDNKNMIIIPITGGIIINIQKVYNHFSRRGKGARRLQRIFEQEYEDDLANDIWNPLVTEYTTLQGDSLQKFNSYFKPDLNFLSAASHYERVEYIVNSLKSYRDSAETIHRRLELHTER